MKESLLHEPHMLMFPLQVLLIPEQAVCKEAVVLAVALVLAVAEVAVAAEVAVEQGGVVVANKKENKKGGQYIIYCPRC